jgi:hypothetical protein
MEAYPYPSAVNSEQFDGRPACNSCGLCSGFGCPINARGDALVSYLNPAVRTGRVRVIDRALVHRIDTTPDGRRATAGALPRRRRPRAHPGRRGDRARRQPDQHRPAAAAVGERRAPDGARQPLGPGRPQHDVPQLHPGRAVYPHDVQPLRAQSTTLQIDDLIGPFTGPEIQAAGLPYVKGGLVQVGSGRAAAAGRR